MDRIFSKAPGARADRGTMELMHRFRQSHAKSLSCESESLPFEGLGEREEGEG